MRHELSLTILGAPIVALCVTPGLARSQALHDRVVGTWDYVAVDTIRPDGTRVPMFGEHPLGMATFDRDGHYVLVTLRAGQSKFATNNRNEGTDAENRAVVQGSIAHFGTYTVNDADGTVTFHVRGSTFPNWNGVDQTRPVSVDGDELRWRTAASSGGTAEVILKRAR